MSNQALIIIELNISSQCGNNLLDAGTNQGASRHIFASFQN